ncbi:hypothetical protein BGZ70_007066 [Mortierella alpina]|uniref:Hydroxymethylglutaryl-CoA synthase n=1 Tax=Mortierella alpina TaxID=64518 RepID=A0A9P6J744_MORAP|nr:hypothetical protein BGZ70_007066 [Mortierella alpina]
MPYDTPFTATQNRVFPANVGIRALDFYFPSKFVRQDELEEADGVSKGKYTIGFGQTEMGMCDDREDINSIALTVVHSLMEKYRISFSDIGFLEVGTETILDKSKSVKTVLMSLFEASGNFDVEGIDTKNACYGGTAGVFHAVDWIESSAWDGRLALVVAADIATYAAGPARPTGGAGAIAILLGPDAPLVFDRGVRASHMSHVWDFYKPDLASEYPVEGFCRQDLDHVLFHAPTCKLVQKAFGRMAYSDMLRQPEREVYASVKEFAPLSLSEESYSSKELERAMMELTKAEFQTKVQPSLYSATHTGNCYTGTLWGCLCNLLSSGSDEEALLHKRIGMYSYGSGAAASFFSLKVVGSTAVFREHLRMAERLRERVQVSPAAFEETLRVRERAMGAKDYDPVGDIGLLAKGTYYLEYVDAQYRRTYQRV